MKDKELKNMLRDAYKVEPSESGRHFVREHEVRNRDLWDVISFEFRNMGMISVIAFIVLCISLFMIARMGDAEHMWFFSSSLTLFTLFPTAVIGKSERYMMGEIETASRFSYTFLKFVRMLILGLISLVIILISSVLLINSIQISPVRTVCFIAIPYLTSVYANILITRKLRSKEALYACTGITMILCIVPYSVQYTGLIDIVNPALLVTILIIILAVTMRQSVLYVKESENIAWNLC